MKKRTTITIIGLMAVCWTAGCGGGTDSPPQPPPPSQPSLPQAAEPSAPATVQASAATEPDLSTAPAASSASSASGGEPPYTYRPGNRRDPFRSIVVAGEKQAEADLLHPLQKYSVGDLRLVAIVWGGFGTSAMLRTPDGKGYTVREGMTVGNREGVVKKIQPDHIVIEERYTDLFGERKEDTKKLELHPQEEGLK